MITDIAQITDWESVLLGLLPEQFRNKVNWSKLISAIAGSGSAMQSMEDTIYALWQQRSDIDQAVGAQLDLWGELVNLPREGWSDTSYRKRILVWFLVLASRCTPDEVIEIVGSVIGDKSLVRLWEHFPAGYSVQYDYDLQGSDISLARDLGKYLTEAKPLGVGIGQIISLGFQPFKLILPGDSGTDVGLSQAGGDAHGLLCLETKPRGG